MDAVEDIKQRLGIEEVISEYVELKRSGRNWKGLSPFGNERTASFMVSPEKQIWHDFSTGKGGTMFGFIMEMEGVDFRGSLEILARKAGIDLAQYRQQGNASHAKEKERLYAVLELATKFYQTQLKSNHQALEYVLQKRGFSKQTVLDWRLGYSPNNGSALISFLKQRKCTDQEIAGAGLSAKRYRGVGDMFRGRIMIPLADAQGRIIGFTARLLEDNSEAPKYINTPQTVLYDKSRHVFGLHFAKEAIRKQGYVVIAEGNLDVITSHQAGIAQVVATAGTAMTEPHLKALSRFTGDIRLSFDADNAGMNATERAIPIASKVDVSLSIVTIPKGKDPDELIRQDLQSWRTVIAAPQYALDWLIERYQNQLDITTAQGKRKMSDIILAVVRMLKDTVEQEHYVSKLSAILDTSTAALQEKLQNVATQTKPRLKKPSVQIAIAPKAIQDYVKTQDHFLCLALRVPNIRTLLAVLTPDMLMGRSPKELVAFLQSHPDFTGDQKLAEQLHPIDDYVKILLLQYDELYGDIEAEELHIEASRLQFRLIEQYVKMKKQGLAQQLEQADEPQTKILLEQARALDALLTTHKGDV